MTDLQPGDVVVVRTPLTWASALIRLGCLLRGRRPVDHVAVVHHVEPSRVVLVEGRPSGVGYAPLSRYRLVSDNRAQPKTAAQRARIVQLCEEAVGVPYDWPAILVDAFGCLHLPQPDAEDYREGRPAPMLVCSSIASWAYKLTGMAEPAGEDRWCRPDDWDAFDLCAGWEHVAGVPR